MQTLGDYYRFTDPGRPQDMPWWMMQGKGNPMSDGGLAQPMQNGNPMNDGGMARPQTLGGAMGRYRQEEGIGQGGMIPYMNSQSSYRPYFTNQF